MRLAIACLLIATATLSIPIAGAVDSVSLGEALTSGKPILNLRNRPRLHAHLQLRLDHRSLFNAQLTVVFPHATFSLRNVALGF